MTRMCVLLGAILFVLRLPHPTIADKCPFDDNENNCDCRGQDPATPTFFDYVECTPARGQFQPIKSTSKLTIRIELTISTADTSNITMPPNALAAFDTINRVSFVNTQYTTIVSITLDPQAFGGVNLNQLAFSGVRDLLPLPRAIVNTGPALTRLTIINGGRVSIRANQFNGFNFLDTLTIVNTQIESIDDRAFSYVSTTLHSLTLSETALSAFPLTAMSTLKNLASLNVTGNNLRKWPKSAFASFQRLFQLILTQNYLQEAILDGTFDNFPRGAVNLIFDQTDLHQIPTDLLKNELSNVLYLNLEGNKISRLQTGDFPLNSDMLLLNLANNPFGKIDDGALQSLPSLLQVGLDRSMLSSFDLSSLNGMDELGSINLNFQRKDNFELKVPQSLKTIWMVHTTARTITADLEPIINRDSFILLYLGYANDLICDQNIDWMAKYVACPKVRISVAAVKCANLPDTYLESYLEQQHPAC